MAKMTEDDAQSRFKALHQEAMNLRDELEDDREILHKKYYGDGYPQVSGRSDAVSMDVRDAINAAMPSIMRVIFGSQRMLEYKATRPSEQEAARQATRYITQLITGSSSSYENFYTAVWDALTLRRGYLKTYHDDSIDIRSHRYTGITEEQMQQLLMDDDDLEVGEVEVYTDKVVVPQEELARRNQEQQAEYQQQMQQLVQQLLPQISQELQVRTGGNNPQLAQQQAQQIAQQQMPPPAPIENPIEMEVYDVTFTVKHARNKVDFEAVPPGEILYTEAKSLRDSSFVAHGRNVTFSDLYRMGYSEDELEDISGTIEEVDDDADMMGPGRATDGMDSPADTEDADQNSSDESMRKVYYVEAWVRMDYDGDGIAELRHICAAGNGLTILVNEYANHCRIASMTPYITAHSLQGESITEQVMDLQDIKTKLLRSMLDNYVRSVNPDTIALEGAANMSDLQNPEVGRVVRVKQLGAVQYQSEPYHGEKVMPLLALMDQMAQKRTGINDTSQGLNADKLQSTSSLLVDAASQAATARIELITRTLCETGLKDFFRQLLREVKEHVNQIDWMEVNGAWQEFDPRTWNDEFGVNVKVAIGAGTQQQQLQAMGQINAKQAEILQTLGPDNQLVGLQQYHESLAEMTRLAGIQNVDTYWKDPSTQPPPQPKPPQPDPDLIRAQTEQQKAQSQAQKDQAQLQLEQMKFQAEQHQKETENRFREIELELDRAKIALDATIKRDQHSEGMRQHDDKQALAEAESLLKSVQTRLENARADAEAERQSRQGENDNG